MPCLDFSPCFVARNFGISETTNVGNYERYLRARGPGEVTVLGTATQKLQQIFVKINASRDVFRKAMRRWYFVVKKKNTGDKE